MADGFHEMADGFHGISKSFHGLSRWNPYHSMEFFHSGVHMDSWNPYGMSSWNPYGMSSWNHNSTLILYHFKGGTRWNPWNPHGSCDIYILNLKSDQTLCHLKIPYKTHM
jgi:hypothetical protein